MHHEYDLSIITVNYNGVDDTCALIDTIPFDEYSLEVIVVDNASARDEATVIEQRYPQVTVIRSERNLGFAGGNNLGIRAARGRYLFFINNDTLLYRSPQQPTDGLRRLLERLDSDDTVGAVCPKIRFASEGHPIQFAGYTPLSPVTMRNRAIGFGEADRGQYDTAHPTPYAHGAAMLVRRDAIGRAGMMPECYFLYYEELDWSMMLRRAGYAIWYDPSLTIYHKESQTTGQNSPLRTYYLTRNRLLFARRNVPAPQRWLTYCYLIGIVALRDIARHTVHRRPELAKATVRGVVHFLKTSQP